MSTIIEIKCDACGVVIKPLGKDNDEVIKKGWMSIYNHVDEGEDKIDDYYDLCLDCVKLASGLFKDWVEHIKDNTESVGTFDMKNLVRRGNR